MRHDVFSTWPAAAPTPMRASWATSKFKVVVLGQGQRLLKFFGRGLNKLANELGEV